MAAEETVIKPVVVLQDQASLLVRNLQPIFLLSILPVFFGRLVQDPASTLLALAPTIAIVQAVYCVCCFPSTGQNIPSTSPKPGQKKKTGKQDLGARLVVGIASLHIHLLLSASDSLHSLLFSLSS